MKLEINERDWEQINVLASTINFERGDGRKEPKIILTFENVDKGEINGYYLSKANARFLADSLEAAIKLVKNNK